MKTWDIPNPCSESWDLMQPSDQGRFCSVCQTQVWDCTAMSKEEVLHLAQSAKGKLCVRTLQKNHTDSTTSSSRIIAPLRQLVAAAAIMTSFTSAYAADAHAADGLSSRRGESNVHGHLDTNRYVLRGVVYDSLTHEVLSYVIVRLKGQPIGGVTDEKGQFEVAVPDNLMSEVLKIEVHMVGYKSKSLEIPRVQIAQPIEIELSFETLRFVVGTIVVDEKAVRKQRRRMQRKARRSDMGE